MTVHDTAEGFAGLDALSRLERLLDLEDIGENFFRGHTPPTDQIRVFGGQVAGQALVAASRTVERSRDVHSLHAYFLRPGDPRAPILYRVDPIRDGRSFTTRRVIAQQHGEAVFSLSASFHGGEEGLSHQVGRLEAPQPEDVPDLHTHAAEAPPEVRERYARMADDFPFELRFVDGLPSVESRGASPSARQRVWIRAPRALPDDPVLHICSLAYASDMFLIGSTLAPHHVDLRQIAATSLDHAMWFHAPFRVDEWLLYDQEGSWTGSGRGLARGQIFDRNGVLVATVMQEGLLRRRS